MKRKWLKWGAVGAIALAVGMTPPLWAEEPQTNGTVKIITWYRTLNPLTWDFHRWAWKTSFDGLHTTQLMAGDLDRGPVNGGSNKFIAPGWIPPDDTKGEIAESWEVKPAPLRIEFKIRPGVMWMAKEGIMESREVVAEDIAFRLKRFGHAATAIAPLVTLIR